MIRVAKVFVVDGVEINVSAEGGSAREALAIVEGEAESLGAAPRGNGAPATRTRRTKAELEAAKSAASAPAPAAASLPGPAAGPEPARVFGGPAQQVPVGSENASFPPGTQTVLPPNQTTGPASFAPGPAAPQESKSVAFDGPPPPTADAPPSPPPPPDSEEDTLRERINEVMKNTIDLQPAWRDAVTASMHRAAEKHGGDIFRMSAEGLRDVLKGVEDYQKRVREALSTRR